MSRRQAPRPLALALEHLSTELVPVTTLGRLQQVWSEVAGGQVAAETEPLSEREGVVTVGCRSSVWAAELELLSEDLLGRVNRVLGGPAVRGFRFVTRPPRSGA